MPYTANYPASVQEVLRPDKKYKPDCLRAVKAFRRSKAWRGTEEERQVKFKALHDALCTVYGLTTRLVFQNTTGSSGSSHFIPSRDKIVLTGKLSVVTYLHEFGHARGYDERKACIFSINLFKRIFPVSFARCSFDGHMVVNTRRSPLMNWRDVPATSITPEEMLSFITRPAR